MFTYSKLAASSLGIQPLCLQASNMKRKDDNINEKDMSFVSPTKKRKKGQSCILYVSFSPLLLFIKCFPFDLPSVHTVAKH